MSPTIEDPRNYITIKPVPEWKEALDSRLKARSLHNYSLEQPTREEVFKSNYARRTCQMSSQGYNSVPWKPYQEVGDPLYLNLKTMIQSSLGQKRSSEAVKISNENLTVAAKLANESQEKQKEDPVKRRVKSASTKFVGSDVKPAVKPKRPMSAVSFVMKHTHPEDLQSVVTDLKAIRENLTKVKMGHALFPMLDIERSNLHNTLLIDKQNEISILKEGMHIQNATTENTNTMQGTEDVNHKSAPHILSSPLTFRRASSRVSLTSPESVSNSLVARKAEVEKSLAEQSRPYTPVHSNISLQIELEKTHLSIWRQLCALHWIIESCQLEAKLENQYHHKSMVPISECWNPLNPGGRTRDSRVVLQEKRNNSKWNRFTRTSSHKHAVGRSRSRRKNLSGPFLGSGLRKTASIASDLGGMKRNPSIASNLDGSRNQNVDNSLSLEEGIARQRPPSVMSTIPNIEIEDIDGDIHDAKASRPSSPGQSSVTTTIAGGTVAGSEYEDDDQVPESGYAISDTDRRDIEEWFYEKDCHEHLKKLLSTVKESVVNEMQRRERTAQFVAKLNKRLPSSVYEWSRSSYFRIGRKDVNISRIVVPAATAVTDYNEPIRIKKPSAPKIRPHTAAALRRRDSTNLTFSDAPSVRPGTATNVAKVKPRRPMSSPAKLAIQFSFKFSSSEKERHLDEVRQQFTEVGDAKALQLHNQLIELEKRRKQRMEIKFDTLNKTSSIHRDLKGMRDAVHNKFMSEKLAKEKKSSMLPSAWYNTLIEHLPKDVHNDDNCNVILEKLRVLGIQMADELRRITKECFLSSLKGLRNWELCSPDVSSAIEFVRENIVQMDTQEFDEWRNARNTQKDVLVGSDRQLK